MLSPSEIMVAVRRRVLVSTSIALSIGAAVWTGTSLTSYGPHYMACITRGPTPGKRPGECLNVPTTTSLGMRAGTTTTTAAKP